MTIHQFIRQFLDVARQLGYRVEISRTGLVQVDFGHKKLHADHLSMLFPRILEPEANIARLVEEVAPGRPCTHKPTREIIQRLTG